MTTAWVIAKAAALKFGGSVKQYLSGALKQAWSAIKTPALKFVAEARTHTKYEDANGSYVYIWKATPKKLYDGTWGCIIDCKTAGFAAEAGEKVNIFTKSGEKIEAVLTVRDSKTNYGWIFRTNLSL